MPLWNCSGPWFARENQPHTGGEAEVLRLTTLRRAGRGALDRSPLRVGQRCRLGDALRGSDAVDKKNRDARNKRRSEIVKVTKEDDGQTLSYEVLSTGLAGPGPPYERARRAANDDLQPYGEKADRWVEVWSLDLRSEGRLSQMYDSRFDGTLARRHLND